MYICRRSLGFILLALAAGPPSLMCIMLEGEARVLHQALVSIGSNL